jgi:hypothetical protein
MDDKDKFINEKTHITEKIVIDLVDNFKNNLIELAKNNKIQDKFDLQAIVSSSAMAFFSHLINHLLDMMNAKMKIDFLNFMRKQTDHFFDKRINEIKLH